MSHPGKVIADLAVTLVLGGDCLAEYLRSASGGVLPAFRRRNSLLQW